MILKKYIKGFLFAISGISFAFRSQVNMRFHMIVALLVIITSIVLKIDRMEWCVILFCIGSVICAELINTSIEQHVDLTNPDYDKKAGRVKDLAAGAVLIAATISAIVGCIIFIPHFIRLIS